MNYEKRSNSYQDASVASVSSPHCLICCAPSLGNHFGVLSCRACAAFFRRTVVENKAYECRQNEQCQIKQGLRNMCRACRFAACLQFGMKREEVQLNRDPIGGRRSERSEVELNPKSGREKLHTSIQTNDQKDESFRGVLKKMAEGLRFYLASQK